MASTIALLQLFLCCFSALDIGIGAKELSKDEDLELEGQLKLLNRPAITTIRTIYGEKYDCVQLNLDHYTMKNYTFDQQMTSHLNFKAKSSKDFPAFHEPIFNNLWVNKKGCPLGTIPVKRITKEDLIRVKLATNIYAQQFKLSTETEPGTHYAVLRTNPSTGKKFSGAGMISSVWNPAATGSQYSSSQMKIQNGVDHIEVGWTVNPSLFNDNRTRLFVYSKAGASSCFNTFCQLYQHESSEFPMGGTIGPMSRSGGPSSELGLFVSRDPSNGDWVLRVTSKNIRIGHWPSKFFTTLGGLANFVEWGGKVYSPTNIPSPPMGAGNDKLKQDTRFDAYCRRIITVNEAQQIVNATNTSAFVDIFAYDIKDEGIVNSQFGHLIVYGGKGSFSGWT